MHQHTHTPFKKMCVHVYVLAELFNVAPPRAQHLGNIYLLEFKNIQEILGLEPAKHWLISSQFVCCMGPCHQAQQIINTNTQWLQFSFSKQTKLQENCEHAHSARTHTSTPRTHPHTDIRHTNMYISISIVHLLHSAFHMHSCLC